jgi:hypothetical protein
VDEVAAEQEAAGEEEIVGRLHGLAQGREARLSLAS